MKVSKKTRQKRRLVKHLDAQCRAIVFERDGNRCQRCGATYDLQWSHVHSRRHPCIRWEPDNSQVLCRGCHCWWGNHPIEAAYWFSQNWPMRWEHVNELLKVNEPVKMADLRAMANEGEL